MPYKHETEVSITLPSGATTEPRKVVYYTASKAPTDAERRAAIYRACPMVETLGLMRGMPWTYTQPIQTMSLDEALAWLADNSHVE